MLYIPETMSKERIKVWKTRKTAGHASTEEVLFSIKTTDVPDSLLKARTKSDDHWVTNSFDTDNLDVLDFVPVGTDEPWETIPRLATMFNPKIILGIFPLIYQLEPRFSGAVHALKMPSCIFTPEQSSMFPLLIETLAIGGAVMTQDVAGKIMEELKNYDLYFQIVVPRGKNPEPELVKQRAFFETHIVPGMVGLFQCEHLSREGQRFLHPSDRFLWEIEEGALRATDIENLPRFERLYMGSVKEAREEQCPCGRTLSVRL